MVYPGDELRPILAQEDEGDDGEEFADETEEKEPGEGEPDADLDGDEAAE